MLLARLKAYTRDVLTAAREVRAISAFVVASALTAAVALPMWFNAESARDDQRELAAQEADAIEVDSTGILVDDSSSEPAPLDGSKVSGDVIFSVRSPGLAAVAYQMRDDDRSVVFENIDESGPFLLHPPSLEASALDTSSLADGSYDVLVTLTYEDGTIDRKAAEFMVENGR